MFALMITYLFLNHNFVIQLVGLSSNLIEVIIKENFIFYHLIGVLTNTSIFEQLSKKGYKRY